MKNRIRGNYDNFEEIENEIIKEEIKMEYFVKAI